MGRHSRPGGPYVTPIDSTGAPLTTEGPRGAFTLSAGTYYYLLGGSDAPFTSAHVTGLDAAMQFTAIVQDCNHAPNDVTDFDSTVGNWVTEDPTTSFVGEDGTNWGGTNGGIAVTGGGVGGAMLHIVETGAARTRLTVTVTVGGRLRVSAHGKD